MRLERLTTAAGECPCGLSGLSGSAGRFGSLRVGVYPKILGIWRSDGLTSARRTPIEPSLSGCTGWPRSCYGVHVDRPRFFLIASLLAAAATVHPAFAQTPAAVSILSGNGQVTCLECFSAKGQR